VRDYREIDSERKKERERESERAREREREREREKERESEREETIRAYRGEKRKEKKNWFTLDRRIYRR